MKTSTQLLFVLLLVALCSETQAQKIGFRAGYNLSTMVVKDNNQTYSEDYSMNRGFHLGPILQLPMPDDKCFLETGLLLSTKGYKIDKDVASDNPEVESSYINTKTTLYYLDIPMTVRTNFVEICDLKVFAVWGGYMSVGLSGNNRGEITESTILPDNKARVTTEQLDQDIDWGTGLKRVDYGLTFGGGLAINAVQLRLTYGMGLSNIAPDSPENIKTRNRTLSFSMDYRFGK